jgi:hypothetical protein
MMKRRNQEAEKESNDKPEIQAKPQKTKEELIALRKEMMKKRPVTAKISANTEN